MRMYDLIMKKRSGEALTSEEISYMIEGYTNGQIPDYQMSALLMAIYFNGMNYQETTDLTLAMVNSGDVMNLSSINGVIRAGIVHRIDKDTSGLLVVCKNDASHESISEQLKAKTTTRKYYALVSGVIEHEFGKINAPIGRNPKNRQQQAVVEDGKPSITHFKVIERLNDATLIECVLETGRTHQIRVHLAYIGHPVLGDPIYGLRKHISPNGQYLHAKTLGFIHPTTKEYMEFDSELPKDFVEKLESLR